MKVCYLEERRIGDFIDYCGRYCKEHDESFLPDKSFKPDAENPTYLLLDDHDAVIGAVSLIITHGFKSSRKGRFRILHTVPRSLEAYRLLTDAILQHTKDIDNIYLFIQENRKEDVGLILETLEFAIQRYAWYLERPCRGGAEPEFPEGYALRPLRWDQDEPVWQRINAITFAKLAGHVDMAVEDVKKLREEETHLDAGMLLLWKGDVPVGTIRITKELENGEHIAFISGVGVLPEYQGKGLATNMIRHALVYGSLLGLRKCGLSVNAENDRAANIYLREGYQKLETVICYNKRLSEMKLCGNPSQLAL